MIEPGDWVGCVEPRSLVFKTGVPYRIQSSTPASRCSCLSREPHFALHIAGYPDPAHADGWCSLEFRPIYRPKPEFIAELVTEAAQ